MALALAYVAALAVALSAGLHPIWALSVPLASPVLYLTVRAIARRALSPSAREGK